MNETETSGSPPEPSAGRRQYSAVYQTAWVSVGVLLLGGAVYSYLGNPFPVPQMFVFYILLSIWSSASPYRFILIPAWTRTVLVLLALAAIYLWDGMQLGPCAMCVIGGLLVSSCFFRYPGREVRAEDDIFSAECWARVASFFRDLRFSIYLLFGLVFGAGLSAPIVLEHFRLLFGQELGGGALVALSIYLLLVCTLGTWTSLGAFGVRSGRYGGRTLRFVVQVLGIVLAAWMTLPLAILATLFLMWWKGRKTEAKEE